MEVKNKRTNCYTLYNAGNKYIIFQKYMSTRTIYDLPRLHLWVCTCTQRFLEDRNGLSSCPLYHKLYFTLCFLCSASRRSSSLKGAALGTPGSFLGFLCPRFLASFLTFRWCSLIWRQQQEHFSQSKAKKKRGLYPSSLQIQSKKGYVSDLRLKSFYCIMSHCKATLERTSTK